MNTTKFNSLSEVAQEIADRYGAERLGYITSNDGLVHFRYQPFNQERVMVTLTYEEIKEHFGYDCEKEVEKAHEVFKK